MIKHEINIYIKPELASLVPKPGLKRSVLKILDAVKIPTSAELGLVITDNAEIQRINKLYRGKDESTDVLAFNMLYPMGFEGEEVTFIAPPDGFSHLGEIMISYPKAVAQAQQRGHDIEHEILVLLIHGILHLLGYDHEKSADDEFHMRGRENDILKQLS
jgi:probable rRNA maturation factor